MTIRPRVQNQINRMRGMQLTHEEAQAIREAVDICAREGGYGLRGPSPDRVIVDEPFDNGSSDRIFSRQDIERAFGVEERQNGRSPVWGGGWCSPTEALVDITGNPPVRPDDPGPYLPAPLKFHWNFSLSEPFSRRMDEPDA